MKKLLAALGILTISFFWANTAHAEFHPPGTNINSNGTVYYIQPPLIGGAMPIDPPKPTLRPYFSAPVFLSYGFNSWNSIVPASSDDLSLEKNAWPMSYADGSLVNDKGTVYIISTGFKYPITSAAVFLGLGYRWENVINGDVSFMAEDKSNDTPLQVISEVRAHMPGTLINQNGTIYFITSLHSKMGFPSMEVFNSWGFRLGQVVPSNDQDKTVPDNQYSPIVVPWIPGKLSPDVGPLPV